MKKLVIPILLLLLLGCSNPSHQLIKEFEHQTNQAKVSKVVINNNYIPFLSKDSAKILADKYDTVLNQKLRQLNTQWNTRNLSKIEAQNELQTIDNSEMKKIFENSIRLIESEQQHITDIITKYKTLPESTQLRLIAEKKLHYKNNPDSVIGYSLRVELTYIQGELPETTTQKKYLFSKDKTRIIGIIEP